MTFEDAPCLGMTDRFFHVNRHGVDTREHDEIVAGCVALCAGCSWRVECAREALRPIHREGGRVVTDGVWSGVDLSAHDHKGRNRRRLRAIAREREEMAS